MSRVYPGTPGVFLPVPTPTASSHYEMQALAGLSTTTDPRHHHRRDRRRFRHRWLLASRRPPATLPTPAAGGSGGGDSNSALLVAIRSSQGGLKKASDRQLADQLIDGRNALYEEIMRGKALKKVFAPARHSPPLIALSATHGF